LMHATYYQERRSAPKGTPLVITVHDMIHEIFPEYFGLADPTSTDKKTAVSRADHIICISESTRRDLIRIFGVPPQKVTTVHHGFSGMDAAATGFPTADLTQRPYLLFVGQRAGYKNFQRLLEAFIDSRSLRDSFDLIAFGGPPFDAGEIRALAAARLRKGQVRHETGDDSVLAKRYRNASAFVYPSLYEGFGLPPLEAMAQGCPVISSNTSSMPEVIGDAAEYFDPTDVSSIAQALLNVLGSAAHSAELVRRGHLRVRQFSWEKCARETRAIYQQVIS
jgi:glycosyltransferase involved in cell wall biosynthesis